MLRGDASFRLFCRAVAAEGGRGRTVHCCSQLFLVSESTGNIEAVLYLLIIAVRTKYKHRPTYPRLISFTRVRTQKYLDFTQIAQQNILLFTSVLLTVAVTFELRAGMEERR